MLQHELSKGLYCEWCEKFYRTVVLNRHRMCALSKEQKSGQPNLYLIGFMGVGKSAIGRRVARELGFEFVDSDHCIEAKKGKKIPEIFATEGETQFRIYERDFVENGHPETGCVVSCGGGLVIQPGMKALLKERGVVVCLFASVDTIYERTKRNTNRPLLNVADPKAKIQELLSEREPIYMDAGICVSTDHRSIGDVAQHIVRTYRLHSNFPAKR